jgi:glycosyltransferase involved in cell wall biosynthesis
VRITATPATPCHSDSGRSVFFITAHNEGAGLANALKLLQETGTEGLQVIVVADNCTDHTAQIARDTGAVVFERTDQARRGKPYALDWALQRLAADLPDVVA